MPDYVCSGVRGGGRREYDWAAGPNADAAVATFAGRGYDDVRVHTDDVTALRPRTPGQSAWDAVSSDISFGWWDDVRAVAKPVGKAVAWMLAIYAVVLTAAWVLDDDGLSAAGVLIPTAGLVFGVGALVCFIVFHPVWQLRAACEDLAWGRWDGVLRRLPQLRTLLPADMHAALEASARAGLGDLDEALALLDDHADAIPEWLFTLRRADVFRTAGRRDDGVAEALAALELGPDVPVVLVDVAGFLTAPDRDPAHVLQLIARLRTHAHSEQIARVADVWAGAALVSLNRSAEALNLLTAGVDGLRPYVRNNPVLGSIRDVGHAHLALAHAAAGDRDEARKHLALAEPRLEARGLDQLLARCDKAVGRG